MRQCRDELYSALTVVIDVSMITLKGKHMSTHKDTKNGYLYWTTTDGANTVQKALLDGTQAKAIASTGYVNFCGNHVCK